MGRIGDWLDERTGWRALAVRLLEEPIPGGARWAYVFGSTLLFLLVVQATTGVLLAAHYSPSVTDAWASVAYLQDQLAWGWLVRGLHSAGASAMVLLSGVHLLQVALYGAYKRPRELNWLVGVVMLLLVLAFALTGYLLPWDQKGYWATQVATSLAGATPLVGRGLQALIQGGPSYGNLTLTHFYALHVLVLPAAMVLAALCHVALFRRHGVTTRWDRGPEELERRKAPFWPDQLLRDVAASAVVLGVLVAWVIASHGADLDAPADPTSAYDARPEWYFAPLFELLKFFPGRSEVVAALGAPLVFLGVLVALPFLDRAPSRSPRERLRYLAALALLLGGTAALGVAAQVSDARSPGYQKERARARHQAERARELAKKGVPPAGGTAVYENDPEVASRRLFAARCASCHVLGGEGEQKGPTLDGWASRPYIAGILRNPDAPQFFGRSGVSGMKPVSGPDEDIAALTEYVYWLGREGAVDAGLRERGAALFKDLDCDGCHEVDGQTGAEGPPNLGGWGTEAWLVEFLRDPGAERFYGKKNKMPRFGDRLSEEELRGLARLVRKERGGP